MSDENMAVEQEISAFLIKAGALKVGITNSKFLKGGPPSSILANHLPNAKSAVVFAIPLDRDIIRSYLAKDHVNARSDHEKDNFRTMIKAYRMALDLAELIQSKGFEAKPIFTNFYIRFGKKKVDT